MFDTITFDTADLRPVLITGPARTSTARELIDAIVMSSSGTVSVARRLDTITDAVVHQATSMFIGVLDAADLSKDLSGILSGARRAGVQLIVLARTARAVPADLRPYMREVVAA